VSFSTSTPTILLGDTQHRLTTSHCRIATALLVRFLQMSIPNQEVAIVLSLFSALLEMGCRNFFFFMFIKEALKMGTSIPASDWRKFALLGKMRVADATNDMIVEVSAPILNVESRATSTLTLLTRIARTFCSTSLPSSPLSASSSSTQREHSLSPRRTWRRSRSWLSSPFSSCPSSS